MAETKDFLKEMGNRILIKRKKLNLSQEQLAEKAGISSQIVSSAERGAKAVRPENLLKISMALGVSADYLLSGNVVDKDFMELSKNLENLTPSQLSIINEIIEKCIQLSITRN